MAIFHSAFGEVHEVGGFAGQMIVACTVETPVPVLGAKSVTVATNCSVMALAVQRADRVALVGRTRGQIA